MEASGGARFVHSVRVRPGDCDRQGVVHHARYLNFFEGAFIDFWREAVGPFPELIALGVDLAVADVSLRYFAPARFDEVIDVAVSAREVEAGSLAVRFDGRVRGGLALRCDIRYVAIRTDDGTRGTLPESVVRALGERIEEEEP